MEISDNNTAYASRQKFDSEGKGKTSQLGTIPGNVSEQKREESVENQNPGAARYRDPHFPPSSVAQSCPPNACECCPFTLAQLEHDKIQFSVFDRFFRNQLLLVAKTKGWEVKERTRDIWIKLEKMHLQLGLDTVTFYTDEPGDLSWIGQWVQDHFSEIYQDISSLIRRVTDPLVIGQDENTIVIHDEKTKASIDQVIDPYKRPDGVLYLKSPNTITPGLKIYTRKDSGLMRCEIVSNNSAQMSSSIVMRHELLALLNKIASLPGLFWEFITRYYPLVVQHQEFSRLYETVAEVKSSFEQSTEKLICEMNGMMECIVQQLAVMDPKTSGKIPVDDDLVDINGFFEANPDEMDFEESCTRVTDFFDLPEGASRLFMVAYGMWSTTFFRGSILIDQVANEINKRFGEGMVKIDQIPWLLQSLRKRGLLVEKTGYDIWFSRSGTMLCRKLAARAERGCL